jgi:hypothetical protein
VSEKETLNKKPEKENIKKIRKETGKEEERNYFIGS